MDTYFKFMNPHPEGKLVGDCVKRAITIATSLDYREVSLLLNRHKKVTGTSRFNDDKNWKSFIKDILKAEYMPFPATKGKPRMNGRTFTETYKDGKYILIMAGHLAACVDGKVYDTWDSTNKCVYGAWEIKQ